jgi:hypothetical protein
MNVESGAYGKYSCGVNAAACGVTAVTGVWLACD